MAFPSFGKKKNVAIPDDCFVELVWEDEQSPKQIEQLKGILDTIDQEILIDSPTMLTETLPYVSFIQAEVLFTSIKENFEIFQLKKVGICRKENGQITNDGEVFAAPFVIDSGYQDLLNPLMMSILQDQSFKVYSYEEKRDYFTDDIFPYYANSLGVSTSQLPQFPAQLPDGLQSNEDIPFGENVALDSSVHDEKTSPKIPIYGQGRKEKVQKTITYVSVSVGILGLLLSIISLSAVKNEKSKIEYLHNQLVTLETLRKNEGKVDLFVRYLLPSLYSGDKNNLKDYIDSGNSKYTKAETGNLQSVIQQSLNLEDNTYHAIYVVAVNNDGNTQSKQIELSFKANKKARFGYTLTEEPVIKDFD